MTGYRITTPAAQDLEDIYEHIAKDDHRAAGRFIQRLTDTFRRLAEMPGMGRKRDDLMPDLRSFPVRAYLVFYRQAGDEIHIIRIMHGARDIENLWP